MTAAATAGGSSAARGGPRAVTGAGAPTGAVLPLLRSVRARAGAETASADPGAVMTRLRLGALAEPGDGVMGALVDHYGPVRAAALVDETLADGDAKRFAMRCLADGLRVGGSEGEDAGALVRALERWRPRASTADPTRVLAQADAVSAGLVVPGDAAWPVALDDLGPNRPLLLWTRGRSIDALRAAPGGALVGSRASTAYGSEVAAELATTIVEHGLPVVSGGAYGIDAVAHRAALGLGGTTIAFLAGGIDHLYPAGNAELFRNICARGVVASESMPGTRPTRWRFLNRNRLIAACAGVVVVVEAGHRSGAINTAHHAAQIGRPLFAVPGPITAASSAGCHRLIAEGLAELLRSPSDLAAALGSGAAAERALAGGAALTSGRDDPVMTRVLDALEKRRAVTADEVARRAGVGVVEATGTLALAALQGRAAEGPSGWRSA